MRMLSVVILAAAVPGQVVLTSTRVPGFRGESDPIVTLGDVDLDGVADYAVALRGAVEVRSAPAGRLVTRVTLPPRSSQLRLGPAGDVDGDGGADGWVADATTLWVFDGATGAILNSTASYVWIDAGHDLDGDGCDDVLLAARVAGGSDWEVWSPRRRVWLAAGRAAFPLAAAGFAGDVDADGRADLVFCSDDAAGGRLVVEVVSGASGARLRSHALPGAGGPYACGAAGTQGACDFDADGHDDYYVFRQVERTDGQWKYRGRLSIRSGRLGTELAHYAGTDDCSSFPCSSIQGLRGVLGFGRFRGDGRLTPLLRFSAAVAIPLGTGVSQWLFEAYWAQGAAALPDVDGDGVDDLVVPVGGEFVDVFSLRSGLIESIGPGAHQVSTLERVARVGDADGDGLEDFGRSWQTWDLAGGPLVNRWGIFSGRDARPIFVQSSAAPTGGSVFACGAGDVDGDGRGDLAVGVSDATSGHVTVSASGGATLLSAVARVPEFGHRLAGGVDWDRDGIPDVLISSANGVYVMSGASGVVTGPALPQAHRRLQPVGDLDGDGARDLLLDDVVQLSSGGVASFGLQPNAVYADAGDQDGDGLDDLWSGEQLSLTVVSGSRGVAIRSFTLAASIVDLDAGGDWDGDGVADVAVGDLRRAAGVVSGRDPTVTLFVAETYALGAQVRLLSDPRGRAQRLVARADLGGPNFRGYTNLYRDPSADAAVTLFGRGCPGARAPRLEWSGGVPRLATTASLQLLGLRGGAPAVLGLGASETAWAGHPLPLSLSPVGVPGCSVFAALDVLAPRVADADGRVSVRLRLPSSPQWLGARWYAQAVAWDASTGEPTFSRAMRGVLGR